MYDDTIPTHPTYASGQLALDDEIVIDDYDFMLDARIIPFFELEVELYDFSC